MNVKKLLTISATVMTLATIGTTFVNVNHPTTADAKQVHLVMNLKKGVPSKLNRHKAWLSTPKESDSNNPNLSLKRRYMLKTGSNKFTLGLAYANDDDNPVAHHKLANCHFKYSQKVVKDTYLLSTTQKGNKNLIEIKFVGKNRIFQRYLIINGKKYTTKEYRLNALKSKQALNDAITKKNATTPEVVTNDNN